MILTGLFGRSILASRSPWLHEQEARAQELDLSYELFDFTDRGLADDDLGPMLERLAGEGFAGVNVTYPFKQAVIPLLDELADCAKLVGAVNTVAFRDGRAIGYNTDKTGFEESFAEGLPGVAKDRVLQLGAGGAGAAVANSLLSSGVAPSSLPTSITPGPLASPPNWSPNTAKAVPWPVPWAISIRHRLTGSSTQRRWGWLQIPPPRLIRRCWKSGTGWPISSIFRWKPNC